MPLAQRKFEQESRWPRKLSTKSVEEETGQELRMKQRRGPLERERKSIWRALKCGAGEELKN